jgi:hypothetical protein
MGAHDSDAHEDAFSPYGRGAKVYDLTEADGELLALPSAPLLILFPVTIED